MLKGEEYKAAQIEGKEEVQGDKREDTASLLVPVSLEKIIVVEKASECQEGSIPEKCKEKSK